MSHKFNTLKTDLNQVFVEGNANGLQMARVFIMFAVPVMSIIIIGLHAVRY